MAAGLAQFLQHLRRLSAAAKPDSDAVLLERFRKLRDEDAFAALVVRHGPLVRNLCGRILANHQDAEDAFQATFLILARKAATVRPRTLPSWLYGVAYRVACKARGIAVRRQFHPLPPDVSDPQADPLAEVSARELLTLFDEELQRLPEVYRLPIILCCLQGRTQEEAARQLGWTPGSLQGRLERGRARLHARLVRRGVTFASAMVMLEAVQRSASAASPSVGFVSSLLRAARHTPSTLTPRILELAQETVLGTTAAKLKIGFILIVMMYAIAAGSGMLMPQVRQESKPTAQAGAVPQRVQPSSANSKPSARTDRYGDPLPPGSIARLGTIRLRHGYKVYALPERDAFLSVFQKFETIRVCKWRMGTGELLHDAEYHLSRGSASHVVSSDGKMLAAAGFDSERESIIRLWDLASGKVLGEIKKPNYHAISLAFSPDSAALAAADGEQTLCLWDLKSKTELRRFEGTKNRWEFLTFSPDGTILASTGLSRRAVRLWDTTTGRELRAFNDAPGPAPECVVFSPDSKTVATAERGEKDRTIRLWDVATGRELRQFHGALPTGALAFSPDGKILAAGASLEIGNRSRRTENLGQIQLWDVSSGQKVSRLPGHVTWVSSLVFSADGKRLISSGGASMKVWDVAAGKEVVPLAEHEEWISSIAFSPDGRQLATSSLDGSIRLWEAATGKPGRIFQGIGRERVLQIAFAPDGRTLIADGPNGSLCIWGVATGREIRRLQVAQKDSFGRFACSLDGRTLAVRGEDGAIALLDAASGAEKRRLTGGKRFGNVLVFSPDGGRLASMSFDSRDSVRLLQVWDVASGMEKLKRTFIFQTPLIFSSDSKTLFGILPEARRRGAVNPSFSLRLWDTAGGLDRTVKLPQPEQAESLAVSRDGRMLAWGNFDGTITLWELAANQVRHRFKEHNLRIPSLAFSPDSKTLASGSEDTTVLLWDVTCRPTRRSDRPSIKQLWADLADRDAAKAFGAIGHLIAAPQQAVAMLQENLKPVPVSDDSKQVARWIAELDSERFEARQQAMAALGQLGERAEPDLRIALDGKPSLEARKRIEELLVNVRESVSTPENLRKLRAVEVLERIGTTHAEGLLRTLANGAPRALLTREAKAALQRLSLQQPMRTP